MVHMHQHIETIGSNFRKSHNLRAIWDQMGLHLCIVGCGRDGRCWLSFDSVLPIFTSANDQFCVNYTILTQTGWG